MSTNLKLLVLLAEPSIELTTKCNIKCLHCYGDYQIKGIEMLLTNIKKLLYDLESMGVKNIEFTGGNISVYPFLYEALKIAYSLKFSAVVLLTNGNLYAGKH